jgi:hypothetical protein
MKHKAERTKTQDPRPKAQDPRPKAQDLKSKTQNLKPKPAAPAQIPILLTSPLCFVSYASRLHRNFA